MRQNIEYITGSEARQMVEKAKKSTTTFHRYARDGRIGTQGESRRDKKYKRSDVEAFLRGELTSDKKRRTYPRSSQVKPFISLLEEEDLPNVYTTEFSLLTAKYTLSPNTIWEWQKRSPVYWILANPENRQAVWGTLALLPLEEDLLIKLCKNEIPVQQIQATDILQYEEGKKRSCFIASANVKPEYREHFPLLFYAALNHFCELYPKTDVTSIFARSDGTKETPLQRIIRECYFSNRCDIDDNAWELRFRYWNPSASIQAFQNCITQKQSASPNKPIKGNGMNTLFMIRKPPDNIVPVSKFVKATEDDITATVEIDESIFGVSDIPKPRQIAVRKTWLQKEPETFYMLKTKQKVVGYHCMVALSKEQIIQILKEEDRPINIQPDHMSSFQPGTEPLNIYVVVTGLAQDLTPQEEGAYGASLVRGIMRLFQRLGRRGVNIGTVYARSRTESGKKLLGDLGFDELEFSPVHGKILVSQDLLTSDKPFARLYRQAFSEYRPTSLEEGKASQR